jgi:hypothetical protein
VHALERLLTWLFKQSGTEATFKTQTHPFHNSSFFQQYGDNDVSVQRLF